jgi:hypothetical protein
VTGEQYFINGSWFVLADSLDVFIVRNVATGGRGLP